MGVSASGSEWEAGLSGWRVQPPSDADGLVETTDGTGPSVFPTLPLPAASPLSAAYSTTSSAAKADGRKEPKGKAGAGGKGAGMKKGAMVDLPVTFRSRIMSSGVPPGPHPSGFQHARFFACSSSGLCLRLPARSLPFVPLVRTRAMYPSPWDGLHPEGRPSPLGARPRGRQLTQRPPAAAHCHAF